MKSRKKYLLYTLVLCTFLLYILMSVQISGGDGDPASNRMTVPVDGWDVNTTRDTNLYVSGNLSAHILPEQFCAQDSFLLVMVCSSPGNFEARSAIRETWGHRRLVFGYNVSLFFLLGETTNTSLQYDVYLESERYGDIIEERFVDSYNNLTLKSVVMLKLVSSYCANNSTKFLLKIDDDMFVNLHLIVKMLVERNNTTDLLMGKLICGAKPISDVTSKWYSPTYMYSGKVYPNYLSGTGYVMSLDVVEKLYKTSLTTPIFHLEDVYITGFCAKKANVKPHNNSLFTYQKFNYDICLFQRLYTAHRFTPPDIRKIYNSLRDFNTTKLCKTRKHNFNNWLVNNIYKVNKSYRKSKCE